MTQTAEKKSPQQTVKHYGFSQVPRILLRGEQYKDLSLTEIGIYTGLKDICGDTGECFYILRNLADVLHTSASTLTRYIPKLRDTWKLITAEKKVRGSGENRHEIWHIKMVNIWAENDALYAPPTSVSQGNTQENFASESSNFVSERNNFVSQGNKDCFNLTDRRRTTEKENHKGEQEGESVPTVTTPPSRASRTHSPSSSLKESSSSSSQKQPNSSRIATGSIQTPPVTSKQPVPVQTTQPGTIGNPTQSKKPSVDDLTSEQRDIWGWWCNTWFNKGSAITLTETAYGHVQTLAKSIKTQEELDSLIEFTEKELADQKWIKQKYVHLGNLVNSRPKWEQTRTTSTRQQRPLSEFALRLQEIGRQQEAEWRAAQEEYTEQQEAPDGNYDFLGQRAKKASSARAAQGVDDDYEELRRRGDDPDDGLAKTA